MKKAKTLLLVLGAFLWLFAPIKAQSTIMKVLIEIIPAQPMPTDEISVEVTMIDRCMFSFSELTFAQPQKTFLATVRITWCSVIQIEPPPTFTSTHTYQLGKLPPGKYEFHLQLCPPHDSTGRCWLLNSQEFQITDSITIKITPPEPTSADEVSVEVKVIPSDFFQVSFSRLHYLPQQVFLAIVSAEPLVCLHQSSFEISALSESTHTYQLGRLNPGRYEFQIQYCFHDCPSLPFAPTDGTEQCQLVESQGFQVAEAPLEKIIDRNGDGYINDDEILWAINLWITGAIVPGSSQAIDDATMLRLIDLWIHPD